MKTVEEKAERYANEMYRDENEWDACYDGYVEAYNEATRWRDTEMEQPENGELVIVKYVTVRGIKKYGIAKFFEHGINNLWIIKGSTSRNVIGWRPIVTTLEEFKENLNISNVRSSYSSELGKLQKELKDAEHRYVYSKNTIEQNKANFDMMIILNKIRKLKGLEE